MRIAFFADPNSVHDAKWIIPLAKEHDVIVLYYTLPSRPHYLSGTDIPVHEVWHGGYSLLPTRSKQKQLAATRRILEAHGTELIHVMYAVPNAFWASALKDWPYIVTTRGSDVLVDYATTYAGTGRAARLLQHSLLSRQFRQTMRGAAWVTCTSALQRDIITRFMPGAGVQVLRTGIPVDGFPFRGSIRATGEARIIYSPRYMKPIYRIERIVEAFHLLRGAFPDYRLWLTDGLGESGYGNRIRALIHKLGLEEHVTLLPLADPAEVAERYRAADLVVMCPKTDGSPNSALEAMASGVPVVMPDYDYDPDLFNRQTVWFTGSEPKAIAGTMQEVLQEPEDSLARKLERAQKVVAEHANLAHSLEAINTVYRHVMEPGRQRPGSLKKQGSRRKETLLVLTTANQRAFTELAVQSLHESLPGNCELLVVDDASSDDTTHWCRKEGIRVLTKDRPRGLTDSWNRAYAYFLKGGHRHLVLSNNDVLFPKGSLEALVGNLGPERWIAGPLSTPGGVGHQPLQSVLYYANPPLNLDDPDEAQHVQDLLAAQEGPAFIPINYINGFCFALHRDIRQIELKPGQLFDEQRINVVNEDDLCARAGGRIVCALKSFVYHYKGASFYDFVLPDGYQLDRNLTWREAQQLHRSKFRQWAYRLRRKLMGV